MLTRRAIKLKKQTLNEFRTANHGKSTSECVRELIKAYAEGRRPPLAEPEPKVEMTTTTLCLGAEDVESLNSMAKHFGISVDKCVSLMLEKELAHLQTKA